MKKVNYVALFLSLFIFAFVVFVKLKLDPVLKNIILCSAFAINNTVAKNRIMTIIQACILALILLIVIILGFGFNYFR